MEWAMSLAFRGAVNISGHVSFPPVFLVACFSYNLQITAGGETFRVSCVN